MTNTGKSNTTSRMPLLLAFGAALLFAMAVLFVLCAISVSVDANSPPEMEYIGDREVEEGLIYQRQVEASDPDNDSLTYNVTSDLPGALVNSTGWMMVNTTGVPHGGHWVNVTVDDSNGSVAWTNFTLTIIENIPPEARFVIYDIAGTKEKLVSTGTREFQGGEYPVYEVFWGDTVKFQSESFDPEHEAEENNGIASEMWDFGYNGSEDDSYNHTGESKVTVTVGQGMNFVYNEERYRKDDDGEAILYGPGWDDDLSDKYSYLIEIIESGNMAVGEKIYLPGYGIEVPDYLDYPVRLTAMDNPGAGNHSVAILRVRLFAERTFYHEVEDEFGNPFVAEVKLTWRGRIEEAADSAKDISAETPVFVFINATEHPLGQHEEGELGIYYDVDVVGTAMQDPDVFGFCNLTLWLPYIATGLETWGIRAILEEKVRPYHWDSSSFDFIRMEDSGIMPIGGIYFLSALCNDTVVERNLTMAPLISTIYEGIHKAELLVEDIEFDRSPAMAGEPVNITAVVRNTGVRHADWVQIRFSVNTVQFYVETIDKLPGGAAEPVRITALYNVSSHIYQTSVLTVSVLLDPHGYIPEEDEYNNRLEKNLTAIKSDKPKPNDNGTDDDDGDDDDDDDDDKSNLQRMIGFSLIGIAVLLLLLTLLFPSMGKLFEKDDLKKGKDKEKL